MKIKNYLFYCVVVVIFIFNTFSKAQNIVITNQTVCGGLFYNIPIANPVGFTTYTMFLSNSNTPFAYSPPIANESSFLPNAQLMFNAINVPKGVSVATISGYKSDIVGKVNEGIITVDGFLNDGWILDKNAFYRNSGINNPPVSLFFNYRYDNKFVYFAGRVVDNSIGTNPGADKVEIYLDAYNIDLTTLAGNYWRSIPQDQDSSKIKSARQIVIPMDSYLNPGFRKRSTNQIPSAYAWPNNNVTEIRDTSGILCVVRTFSGNSLPLYTSTNLTPTGINGLGYDFEIAVPLYNFFGLSSNYIIDPTTLNGYSFGFNITSNNSSGQIFHSLGTDNGNSYQNTASFGSVTFSESNPQAFSSFVGLVTITNLSLPAAPTLISSVGDCSTGLTISGILTSSISGSNSFWQANTLNVLTVNSISNVRVLDLPIPKELFYNTLFENGCWSETTTIPIIPAPLQNNGLTSVTVSLTACNFATFNASTTGIANQNYYWQTSISGISNALPSLEAYTITGAFEQTIYLKAQNTITGCWSEPLTVVGTPSTVPGITPEAIFASSLPGNCVGADVFYTTTASGSNAWFWQFTPDGESFSNNTNLANLTSSGMIYLRSKSNNCWSTALGTNININDVAIKTPEVIFNSSIAGNCVGADVFYTTTALGSSAYFWQSNANGTSNANNTKLFNSNTSGLVYLRNFSQGCWSSNAISYNVDLNNYTIPSPIVSNLTYFINENVSPLTVSGLNNLGTKWFMDANNASVLSTAPTPPTTEKGIKEYFVAYTLQNCVGPKSIISVDVKEPLISIPKLYGMTANGDGANEKFVVDNISSFTGNKVTILDKWGNIVFEKENYVNEFDGKSNGKDLPFGSYMYLVDLKDGKKPISGSIILSR
ncbi:MAG: gliding motility-associated C-terminal domain-containing protein [Cytophagales bacterium]|nr:MAG: gliding motility-associated C-terminal domain-containing protein [Cytophagales bacterium]